MKKRSSSLSKSIAAPVHHKEPNKMIALDPKRLVQRNGNYMCMHIRYMHFRACVSLFIIGIVVWLTSSMDKENKNKKFDQWTSFPTIMLCYALSLLALIFVFLPLSMPPISLNVGCVLVIIVWMIWLFYHNKKK